MPMLMAHLSRNAVGYLALFVALGGTSYAALRVRSGNIVNNTIRSSDIRNNTIGSSDIRNNTIRSRDIRDDTITGRDIDEASLGKVGDADTLDGKDSLDFLPKTGTATNSDRLQGLTAEQLRAGLAKAGVTDVENAEVTVGSIGFLASGGPEVTVDVPPSGLVSLYGEAEIKTVGGTQFGVVGLFMDGAVFPGLDDCGGGGGNLLKQTANTTYIRTVTRPDGDTTCSTQTRPGAPLVLRTTPGQHTFEFRYVSGNPAFDADFRNRVLSVTPLP